jgi:hypothetical protein
VKAARRRGPEERMRLDGYERASGEQGMIMAQLIERAALKSDVVMGGVILTL